MSDARDERNLPLEWTAGHARFLASSSSTTMHEASCGGSERYSGIQSDFAWNCSPSLLVGTL